MAIGFWVLGITVFWFSVYVVTAIFIQKLTDHHLSARSIGFLREMINRFKEQKPNQYVINHDKLMTVDSNREIDISAGKINVHFTENEAKMLIIHLLSVYPEMDNPEDKDEPENKELTQ